MPEMDDVWDMKVALPEFKGTDPAGWIAKAERFFAVQGIPAFHRLQWVLMSMDDATMYWFHSWHQENPDPS